MRPKTETILKIKNKKKYKPHLILSFITNDRTYDFQFKNIVKINKIYQKIKNFIFENNFIKKLPSLSSIDIDYLILVKNQFTLENIYVPNYKLIKYNDSYLEDLDLPDVEIFNLPDVKTIYNTENNDIDKFELPDVNMVTNTSINQNKCPLCMNEFTINEEICELECKHISYRMY